ncbi:hypothetical protein [Oscillibacter sp.]|uniref:hypothetical protein n=1 Tax=Oscillibacter sp. TaxID=1945593 RepID=UPI0028A0AE85|nr:hypothetical protein [Oscillibacter sp.]
MKKVIYECVGNSISGISFCFDGFYGYIGRDSFFLPDTSGEHKHQYLRHRNCFNNNQFNSGYGLLLREMVQRV